MTKQELTVSLRELVAAQQGRCFPILFGAKVKARLAFTVHKVTQAILKELEAYEATRLKLCEKLGELNEETGQYEFGDNQKRFVEEMNELLDTEVTLPIGRIPVEALEESNIQLLAAEAGLLAWLITV